MMPSEIFSQPWQFPNLMDSAFNEFEQSHPSDDIFSQFHHFPTQFPTEFDKIDDDLLVIDYPIEDFLMDFDGVDVVDSMASSSPSPSSTPSGQVITEDRDQWSPLSSSSQKSGESSITEASIAPHGIALSLPAEDMEIDSQLSLHHLLTAYREALEIGQAGLMEAIAGCAVKKADPLSGPLDRLVFNLFRGQSSDDYIGQESGRNFEAAFQAFYQAFPFGRFAHFAANREILGSAGRVGGSAIRIVDFDLREGVQWAPVIEAMAALGVGAAAPLRLTSMRWDEDDDNQECRSFQDVAKRLCDYAREFGMELKVEEMSVNELMAEAKNRRATPNGGREWIAFNCLVGLPQMGRKSMSRKLVDKFLHVAQEIITANNGHGIVTFGEGDAFGELKSRAEFGDFFDGCLGHYQTVLKCVEAEFPSELLEARLAMETLFVSPSIDPTSWAQMWEDVRGGLGDPERIEARVGRLEVSRESLMEARELVGGKSRYGVEIGERENEMVLQWRGTPLVRFSAWGR